MEHCKGDLCPHSPAVARGRRATSPVGPKPIASYLAFSGIAASPPSARRQHLSLDQSPLRYMYYLFLIMGVGIRIVKSPGSEGIRESVPLDASSVA